MIETVKSNKSDDQGGTFDRNYTEVKRITTLTSKNGVVKVGKGKDSKLVPVPDGTKVPFTGNMKIVYAYLFTFQDNKERRNYPAPIHPNMDLIAWENGITKPTAQKAVDALMQAGVLIKGHIQVGGGFMSNNYVVLKPSKVVTMGITPSHPNEAKSKNQKLEEVEQNGKSESKEPNHAAVEPSALGNGEQYSIRQPADHRGHDVSPGDDEVDENGADDKVKPSPWVGDAFLGNGKLAPGSREWAKSQGAKTWEEEIKMVWKLSGIDIEPTESQRPDDVPESQPVEQQKPKPKPEPETEFYSDPPF